VVVEERMGKEVRRGWGRRLKVYSTQAMNEVDAGRDRGEEEEKNRIRSFYSKQKQ
jgi:hypothetical protein